MRYSETVASDAAAERGLTILKVIDDDPTPTVMGHLVARGDEVEAQFFGDDLDAVHAWIAEQ